MSPRRLASSPLLAGLLLLAAARPSAADDWQATLDRVTPAVVVLRVSVPRAFDTDVAAYETATGFVVDAERGLILTNRHVVKPGPSVAEAVFLDHEEIPVRAVYRDPVHDFGFFQFDPADVKFMAVTELDLAPENARVGAEVRVVGNDAGEKLSILSGTLARLDRRAPRYGRDNFNDFNTFYYQAASSTSGGSSGSPVIDIHGKVVAMNAGASRQSSSSFYLPLDRVVWALEFVRRGEPVPRGTVQAVFQHRPYDELRRLGLRSETESRVRERFAHGTGMLVVDEIVPGGPAEGRLAVGDVLVRVGGEMLASFDPVTSFLDESVGRELEFEVERGGEPVRVAIEVQDLHSITPDRYLEMGGAVIHPLSYQQARNHAVPVRGLYLATPGYVFSRADVPPGTVITQVGGVPVATLSELEARIASYPDGQRVPIRYFDLANPQADAVAIITIDRRWYPMQICRRDDATGLWPCEPSPPPPPMPPRGPVTTTFSEPSEKPARALAPSLVMLEFDVPFRIDGIHSERFQGSGLVVDRKRGLVVTDRETVPVALGDLTLTFAGSVAVPGEVVYLHPTHNLAVVSYDPALLGDTPIEEAEFDRRQLAVGDDVWLVGLDHMHQVVSRKTEVARVEAPRLPLTVPPRFRESNIELVVLSDVTPTVGGALTDEKGRVLALWEAFSSQSGNGVNSFFAGVPSDRVLEIVEPLRSGTSVGWRDLGAELTALSLADARNMGLAPETARRIEDYDHTRRRVLAVGRVTAGTASAEKLEVGDLLLAINGRPAVHYDEVERASQAERVGLSLLRDGKEIEIELAATPRDGRGTDRCLLWAGTLLQMPHLALAAQRGIDAEGVYVSWLWYGSPANRYGLRATRRIVAVDGVKVPDLDAFLAAVEGRADRAPVRLRTIDLDGREEVVTLKLDLAFWPTSELRRGKHGWERIEHEAR